MTTDARDYEDVWQALPNPALILGPDGAVREINGAAENFLAMSNRAIRGRDVPSIVGPTSRLAELVGHALGAGIELAEYNFELNWPEAPPRVVDLFAAPIGESGELLLMIHPRARAESMDRALYSRNAARSIVGLSAMLAHEVKNPLAGISGAAQLLMMSVSADEQELARLIQDEATRIGNLLSRVEQFGDLGSSRRIPVNIHDVIDRARAAAEAGFAGHVRFVADYDPSLPPTMGDPDQLIQIFQNLLKNAAEATPRVGGMVTLRTAYRAGVKVATPSGQREALPLQVTVSDNGGGVPEELKSQIFEPFVTSKTTGSGLGLALVSKIVADHGGVISCESDPGWTTFRLLLPVASRADLEAYEAREDGKKKGSEA